MPCPEGEHRHLGENGKMRSCHPIEQKHKEGSVTQRYHLMALNQGAGDKTDEFSESNEVHNEFFTPEQKQRLEANKKKIKQFIKQLSNSKLKVAFIPVIASMTMYDTLSKKSMEYQQKAKSKKDQQDAEQYQTALEEIYDIFKKYGIIDKDVNEISVEEAKAVKPEILKRCKEYREKVKADGGIWPLPCFSRF